MTGKVIYELPEIVDVNANDTFIVSIEGGLDESFMKYDLESNSIIIDKNATKFGKYEIQFKIEDALKAHSTSTFEIDIQEGIVAAPAPIKPKPKMKIFKKLIEWNETYIDVSYMWWAMIAFMVILIFAGIFIYYVTSKRSK